MSPLKLHCPNLLFPLLLRRYSLFVLKNNADETARPNDDSAEARMPLAGLPRGSGQIRQPKQDLEPGQQTKVGPQVTPRRPPDGNQHDMCKDGKSPWSGRAPVTSGSRKRASLQQAWRGASALASPEALNAQVQDPLRGDEIVRKIPAASPSRSSHSERTCLF